MLHVEQQGALKQRRRGLLALLTFAAVVMTAGCEDPVSPVDDASVRFDASVATADASPPDVSQIAEDAGSPDAAPDDSGTIAEPDASVDGDGGLDAGLTEIQVKHENLYPAAERAESGRYKLRGRVSTNVIEATDGTHRLRGAFAPLQN